MSAPGGTRGTGRAAAAVALLSLWVGGALVTAAVVAPAAFAVLPSRTLAGNLVGAVLPTVFIAGIVVAAAVPALTAQSLTGGARRGVAIASIASALGCAVSQFGITPKLDRLRAEMGGPVDALPLDDARRVAFGLYHGYNVAGLGVAMLGATVCLGFLLATMRPRN